MFSLTALTNSSPAFLVIPKRGIPFEATKKIITVNTGITENMTRAKRQSKKKAIINPTISRMGARAPIL